MTELYARITDLRTLEAAWQRVVENGGCRGSDGVTLNRFARYLERNLGDLQHSLRERLYHPFPLMRFAVPKRRKQGQRFLSVPTVRDRVAQTAAFLVTRSIFEAEYAAVSHAYREGRGVRTAVYAIKAWRDKGYKHAVDADIDDFFDSVSHDLLLHKLDTLFGDSRVVSLFEKWIRAEVYDGVRIWTLKEGIPQGSVVSPHLANLLLDELDDILTSLGMKLVRYGDDFLILCKTLAEAEDAVELTDIVLEDLHLDLNPLKTKIVSFDEGFKFLGAIFMHDGIFLPMLQKKKQPYVPRLPRPLNLLRYFEMKHRA